MQLFLSAQDINELVIGLIDDHVLVKEKKVSSDPEGFLSEIDGALRKWSVEFNQLDGVIVVRGPGSPTSLRVTVTIANTIGFVRQIPVAGLVNSDQKDASDLITTVSIPDKFEPLAPYYDRPAV